jgi:hypothetical protein
MSRKKKSRPKGTYTFTQPKYVGVFPVRQDIEILPADDPNDTKLHWKAYEYIGVEVYKDADNKIPLTKIDDIKIGDELFIYGGKAIVKTEQMAETEHNFYWLEFDKDDRHCWACGCVMNKKALDVITKLKLEQ